MINDFNPKIYAELNPDLKLLTISELFDHYNNHGFYEKRLYKYNNLYLTNNLDNNNLDDNLDDNLPLDFNPKIYAELNPDLKLLTISELITHYINYGFYEKRLYKYDNFNLDNNPSNCLDDNLPLDFNPKIYAQLNLDLKLLSISELIKHYINYGFYEKRLYKYDNLPLDFDWQIYREIYDDLNDFTEEQAIIHYINNGLVEKREYNYTKLPQDFDWQIYLEINDDIVMHYNNLSKTQTIAHYLNYGYQEKRRYKHETINVLLPMEGRMPERQDIPLALGRMPERQDISIQNEIIINLDIPEQCNVIKKKINILLFIGYDNQSYLNFYKKMIKNIIINEKYIFKLYLIINYEADILHITNEFNDYLQSCNIQIFTSYVENYGADTLHYLNYILNNDHDYDFLIKLHTKRHSYWTYLLNSIFMNLDDLIDLFDTNNDIGIIGHNRYLQPLFFGLNEIYKKELNKMLTIVGIQQDINIDYLDILNTNIITNFTCEQSQKYLNYRPDLFYANFTHSDCFQHFNHHKNIELNHGGYNINDSNFIKFIAGTIFITRGSILQKIKDNYSKELIFYANKVEKIKYYPNFDHNGTIIRYTNLLEYFLQAIIYKFNYKVYGYDPTELLSNSLYLKNFSFQNIIIPVTNKPKILFISNELSKTGAPIILYKIIKSLIDIYDIYLLSYYGGDDVITFQELVGIDRVFIIYTEHRELGFSNFFELANICKKLCNDINPELVYINTVVNIYAIYGCYNKSRKIILHIHEANEEIINLYNDNLLVGYNFLKYVNHLITVNENLAKLFQNYCNTNIKQTIIYNDIHLHINNNLDKETFFKSKTSIIIDYKCKIIGGVGSIGFRKGFDIFIKLAELYSDFIFIWASNNNYDKELPKNMIIINCSSNDIYLFYKYIDILLFTSRSEAFPLAFWECLLANKYVLCSNKTIPLSKNIFDNCNIELLNGISCVELFIPFLNQILNNEINLIDYNNKINIAYISKICSNNIIKIQELIVLELGNITTINYELEYPEEYNLYNKLTIYNKLSGYNLQQDLLTCKFKDFNNSMNHLICNGLFEGRNGYKFPCLVKKRILFVLHELTLNGATKVGLDIANNLQTWFDVIIISWVPGPMINDYSFLNKPIIINYREYEHDIIKYLDRVEIAREIISELKPDLVYINSSVAHDFFHAACNLNIPNIYHNHEGTMGYECEIQGSQIPILNFCKYYKSKSLYYSPSPLTTDCMVRLLGIDKIKIKEFQMINFIAIDNLKNIPGSSIKINEKKIIGMVGHPSFRKGYDLFLELAKKHNEYTFCWVGCDIDSETLITDNLILVKQTLNPYIYIKQFDYFLCTSREDLFPIVLIESLYLNIPTLLLKSSISVWDIFARYGGLCYDGNANYDTFDNIINNLNVLENNIIRSYQIKQDYDIVNNIQFIINDIITLTDGLINDYKISDKYYFDDFYGYMTYDNKKMDLIINNYHNNHKQEFNYEIYKNKYQDLAISINSEEDYKYHWYQVGYKKRTMIKDDWKLYIAININILQDCIDSKEKFIEKNIDYKNIIYNFDTKKYINKHPDLLAAFKDDLEAGYNHFKNSGYLEGRLSY